jgi:hypothetical protein
MLSEEMMGLMDRSESAGVWVVVASRFFFLVGVCITPFCTVGGTMIQRVLCSVQPCYPENIELIGCGP